MRWVFIPLYLLFFSNVLFAQPVNDREQRALESVNRFCDKNASDDVRLREAERLKWNNLSQMPEAWLKLAVVAKDKECNSEIRSAALVLWYRNEAVKAVESCLAFLKDSTNGDSEFRLGCLQLVFIELLEANEEQEKYLVEALETVMTALTDDITVRIAITYNLGRRNNPSAIALCVRAVADNIVEPSMDCPIDVRMAIDVLKSNRYFSYLRTACNNPNPEIRLLLVDALSWDLSPESFNILVSFLQDTQEEVRVRSAAMQVIYMRHAEYTDLVIPLIKKEEDDELRKMMIRTLHLYVRQSDWLAIKAHRNRLRELGNLCGDWSKSFQGESQVEAAIAAAHFKRLQEEK